MKTLKQLENYALSDKDIYDLTGKKLVVYTDLYKYDNIFDVFGEDNFFICLLLSEPNHGHYICLINYPKEKKILYFDPYGKYKPEDELYKWQDLKNLKKLNEDSEILVKMLKDSGCKIVYNLGHFQKDNKGISTCGRHSGTRAIFSGLSQSEYNKLMKKIIKDGLAKDADEFVCKFTYEIIGK